ncbi:MAG TPA: PQQ-binding-like beta-propeller repeat protein [Vicinamibacterales bacterium]|nr:PQQ-binding-like beta-propeller repeat protein [Vicinamibacterales bacterium]
MKRQSPRNMPAFVSCTVRGPLRLQLGLIVVSMLLAAAAPFAEDWPEYRGAGRRGVWNETGILDRFPEGGLKVLWRAPVKVGYSSPVVARGRVFVTDFVPIARSRGTERLLCFDEKTGTLLWKQEWEASYGSFVNTNGAHATPTADGDRVYALGTAGTLLAVNAVTGEVLWGKDFVKDFRADLPTYGFVSAPIVDGDRLIAFIGHTPDGKVFAFDKMTGREIWRAHNTEAEIGTSQPFLIEAGGARQLIVWDTASVTSLNPVTGATYWTQPFRTGINFAMAHSGARLLISTFEEGPMMLELDQQRPGARAVWRGHGKSEIDTDKLHSSLSPPIIDGDYIYGVCSYGQLRALDARTGERIWESRAVTVERTRWVSAQMVQHGDRVFITNDRGELILARLRPTGYEEISRTPLVKPTSDPRGRFRKLGAVYWSHPAYANRHIYARNDEELIAVTLAADDYR